MYFLWILETSFFVNGDNVREEQYNEWMDRGDESLGHNGKTVGVVSPDVRAQSDYAKLNVSLVFSPFPPITVFL